MNTNEKVFYGKGNREKKNIWFPERQNFFSSLNVTLKPQVPMIPLSRCAFGAVATSTGNAPAGWNNFTDKRDEEDHERVSAAVNLIVDNAEGDIHGRTLGIRANP